MYFIKCIYQPAQGKNHVDMIYIFINLKAGPLFDLLNLGIKENQSIERGRNLSSISIV